MNGLIPSIFNSNPSRFWWSLGWVRPAFSISTAKVAVGVIIYSADGVIVDGTGKQVFASSAFMLEAFAVRELRSLLFGIDLCCF